MTLDSGGAEFPATVRRVRSGDVGLSVAERGDSQRPTVVLVHGYPDTSAVWEPVAALLAPQFHVVTYDVRGAGSSDAPEHVADYRLPLLLADLASVLDATSPDKAVHLVGHDWGSLQGWEAVCGPALSGRIASYTSISGPPLGHVAAWVRQRLAQPTLRGVGELASQALRSSYIALFHTPGVAWATKRFAPRAPWLRTWWANGLSRSEGVPVDDGWPAPTFARDLANGMSLYRANIGPKLRDGIAPHTDVPVQIVVAERDRYVPPGLLAGLELASPDVWWRTVSSGHWVPRREPGLLAVWLAEFVEHVQESAPHLPGR